MDNSSTMLGLFSATSNILMRGWLGTGFLFVITFIIWGAFITQTNNAKVASAATGFICATLAILLFAIGLIPQLVVFGYCVFAAISIGFSFKN